MQPGMIKLTLFAIAMLRDSLQSVVQIQIQKSCGNNKNHWGILLLDLFPDISEQYLAKKG